ncbi:tetratricopeptide repeat protein [Pleomorphovibrio marinus]|uniref:tetratricopeptide repeat protein n=1 Tax=Pleomorphovibrio marinus TaxID=2164132 RepID=UPI000E0A5219|nr:tetratricopeptide repeat protein [Pleomorphovibrio marinus]
MSKSKVKKPRSKADESNELLENPDAIATRLSRGETFLKQNTRIVAGAIVLMILIIAGILFYQIHKANQNKTAQAEMFQAVYYFEQDSVELALQGDGSNRGFLYILDNYSGTDAANLANYYVGSIYLSQGEFQKAADHLKKFSSSDYLIQAQAYALTGDAYVELGDTREAIRYYKRAADHKPNQFFTPKYLSKLAIAYEDAGEINNAISTYERIENEYFDSYEQTNARKHRARLEGLASN